MKFHQSLGPNPRVVRMFIQEKGLDIEDVEVDIMAGENRQPEYLKKNPSGGSPALETDDGQFLTEITAICEYLEELHPSPALIGSNAWERAETRMWTRRVDLQFVEPLTNGFRYSEGLGLFEGRMHCIPAAGDDLKQIAQEQLAWLNDQIEGKDYLAGDRFTLADILLYAFVDFGAGVGQPYDRDALSNIASWQDRVAARPTAASSKHAAEAG